MWYVGFEFTEPLNPKGSPLVSMIIISLSLVVAPLKPIILYSFPSIAIEYSLNLTVRFLVLLLSLKLLITVPFFK